MTNSAVVCAVLGDQAKSLRHRTYLLFVTGILLIVLVDSFLPERVYTLSVPDYDLVDPAIAENSTSFTKMMPESATKFLT